MLTSYMLSRTLIPILIDVLVKKEYDVRFAAKEELHGDKTVPPSVFKRFHAGFERGFAEFQRGYLVILQYVSPTASWSSLLSRQHLS
jgi:multidrug efflux pump subunit AcrB